MPGPGALTPRAKVFLVIGLLVLVGLSVHRLLLAPPAGLYTAFGGATMGTTWSVKVAADLAPDEMRQIGAAIQARLDEVNDLMSTYDPESELSRWNAQRSTEPIALSPLTLHVLQIALVVGQLSGGALDVTVGPLVDAWGFGSAERPKQPPTPEQVAELLTRVGQDRLQLDAAAGTLRKQNAATEIDLSAVAKGFGVDRVAEALEELGYHDYLVEVGGELRASGAKRGGAAWRVAIERPDAGLRVVHEAFDLRELAMATSGDYRNYYERDGLRISHTLDPRTGAPIRHELASVTVLDPSAARADALATAINVLGPDAGYDLAEREGLAAYLLVRRAPGEFEARITPAFERARDGRPSAGE
jgi:thiamine biosynthesis lipoprotein